MFAQETSVLQVIQYNVKKSKQYLEMFWVIWSDLA